MHGEDEILRVAESDGAALDIEGEKAAIYDSAGTGTISFNLYHPTLRAIHIVMSIALVGIYGSLITSVIASGKQIPTHPAFYLAVIIPGLIGAILLYLGIRSRLARIQYDSQYLEFSFIWNLQLHRRLKRNWSDIHSVQIVYPEATAACTFPTFAGEKMPWRQFLQSGGIGPCLVFDFKSGGSATLHLSLLSRSQAEELFAAIDKYGDQSKLSSDFVKLQKAIVLEHVNAESFTQLWSEDLNPNYCATSYVPLPGRHRLQEGRYEILMELAAGGMSAVYLARHKENSNAKVVLKESVLPQGVSEEQRIKARELFEREAHLLLKLNHPHIARVLDRFVEDGRDYLVLEYIPGLTLRQLVQTRGKQKEKTVLTYSSKLLEILAYLHEQNPPLIHRDLTPDNIILRKDGSLCVVDFGAANELVGQATGTMIGKQCYIAPEQLRGKASQASDLYALGGTLHFLLTGSDPEALSASNPQNLVPEISSATTALINQLTAFEAECRPKSARALLEKLCIPTSSAEAGNKQERKQS